MDGHAGRNQPGFARRQYDRTLDAGTQIEAGRARRGVMRQLIAQAGVENLHIHLHIRRDFVS
jgi:hypothetical protein